MQIFLPTPQFMYFLKKMDFSKLVSNLQSQTIGLSRHLRIAYLLSALQENVDSFWKTLQKLSISIRIALLSGNYPQPIHQNLFFNKFDQMSIYICTIHALDTQKMIRCCLKIANMAKKS